MSPPRLIRVVELIHQRRARRARVRRSSAQRILAAGALLLGALSVLAAVGLLFAPQAYAYLTRDLPALEALPRLFDTRDGILLQPTIFYDSQGGELLRLERPGHPRRFIDIESAPILASALVAERDPDYWTQPAFSLEAVDAPFSIPEELVQEFLYEPEAAGWLHRLRLRLLAAQLTEQYGRGQVLSWYANSRVFGHYAVGVQSASQLYFGKAAADLNLAEAALLAPVAQAPALNPIDAPELATQRQQALLLAMLDQDRVNEAAVTDALVQPPAIQPAPEELASTAPEFTRLALAQLQALVGFEAALRGGLEVHTSFDPQLQAALESQLAEQPEAQAMVLDLATGQILAMHGRADLADHAPGRVLSPFAYLSVFARGSAPANLAWDLPEADSGAADGVEFRGPVSLRQALANNYLTVETQVVADAGRETVAAAAQAGFDQLSAATGQISLLDTAQAYATLANLGARRGQPDTEGNLDASALLRVTGPDGQRLMDGSLPGSVQVFSPDLAYLVTDVLGDASARQDAEQQVFLRQVGRPAALHLSPLESGSLAIAYSPQRVVVVSVPAGQNAVIPLAAIFQAAHAGLPIETWPTPSGLASAVVCVPGGGLPGPDCPQTRRELFLASHMPTHVDAVFQRVAINRLSGNLATVFTAPEFTEEGLFIQLPEALSAEGLPSDLTVLPEDYDSVLVPAGNEHAAVQQPAAFEVAAGTVALRGNAGGEGFAGYQLAVGQGLRPSQWIELGPAAGSPVSGGLLGRWDTRAYADGLYAIRLQVRYADGGIETVYTLVTVDNQPPELQLLSDLEGVRAGQEFSIRLLAEDSYGVSGLDIYIDGILMGRVEQPPYQLGAELGAGAYTLRVIASDQAGNVAEFQQDFEVAP